MFICTQNPKNHQKCLIKQNGIRCAIVIIFSIYLHIFSHPFFFCFFLIPFKKASYTFAVKPPRTSPKTIMFIYPIYLIQDSGFCLTNNFCFFLCVHSSYGFITKLFHFNLNINIKFQNTNTQPFIHCKIQKPSDFMYGFPNILLLALKAD